MQWGLKPEDRFWEYVTKRGPDQCWFWRGLCSDNRPKFRWTKIPSRTFDADRVAWCLGNGHPIEKLGKVLHHKAVLHSCGKDLCMNPAHLVTQTNQERLEKLRALERIIKAYTNGIKASGCWRCGFKGDLRVLHFHHREPKDKLFTISAGYNRSLDSIKAEVAKCDVLCLNCHTLEHLNRSAEAALLAS